MTRTSTLLRLLVFTVLMFACSTVSLAQFGVGVSVSFAPPELPVYEQPLCPGDGYIWTPGYWAWDDDGDDYYWVPGTWVIAPEVGFFWTPGYWGWGDRGYIFNQGYWGPEIGFYGGINYGYGYFGHGYEGGRWDNGHFFYNRSVNNVNTTVIHNVYNTTVVNNYQNTRVSYNGGQGGVNERPTSREESAAQQRHVPPVAAQTQHIQAARSNQELRASVNHGKPPVAATPKPADFHDRGVVAATNGGRYTPPSHSTPNSSNRPPASTDSAEPPAPSANPIHPKEVPPHTRPEVQNSGNANADKKYQQQQEKLYKQQEKDHQKLQQQQDKEHQKFQQKQEKQQHNAAAQQDAAKKQQAQQQMEQRHQQQTQQLEQKHIQQQQRSQPHPQQAPRQEAPPSHPSNPPKPPHN